MIALVARRVKLRLIVIATTAVITISPCLAGPTGVRIKNPTSLNLVDGSKQTFSGDAIEARTRNAANTAWVVKWPKVRLEYWFEGSIPLLITSSEVSMTFPVEWPDLNASRGAWSGDLTVHQQGGYIFPYELYATPMDAFNDLNEGSQDSKWYAMVPAEEPPPKGQ